MKLIDADALVERLKPYISKYGKTEFPYSMVHDAFIDEIEQEPTVDAVPVVHGKWIDEDYYSEHTNVHVYRCSECGWHMIAYPDELFRYCPSCGARMDGES